MKGADMASDKQPKWKPSGNFYFAMTLAGLGHENEVRKGSDIPYLGHLLGVASIVIEAGGTEDQAAGALLHDLLEDTPTTYKQLVTLIGKPIADIVQGCTDTTYARKLEIKKKQKNWPDDRKAKFWWTYRKLPYAKKIKKKNEKDPSLLVSLADKTYNAENTVADLRKCSSAKDRAKVWKKFNVGYDYQCKWYRGLLEAFRKDGYSTGMQDLFNRFEKAVNEMFPEEMKGK
jgi:(p)ppGpp synthase/HD superfamily hydrolase